MLRVNGHAVRYGSAPSDYLTNVLNNKAVALIHRDLPGPKPLFMAVDQAAPHTGANTTPRCHDTALPAPGDLRAFVDEPLRRPPSFNEADVSDKPRFVQIHPRLGPEAISDLRRIQNCRLASLLAVDRGVGRIVNALAEEHQLSNTAIFYTSDNGFLLGEHRLTAKVDPYEADLRVPFIVRLPQRFLGPEGAPNELGNLVANVDIAPTILSLAGAQPCNGAGVCRVLDGRSLLPAIQSDGANWPPDRAIPLELKTSRATHTRHALCLPGGPDPGPGPGRVRLGQPGERLRAGPRDRELRPQIRSVRARQPLSRAFGDARRHGYNSRSGSRPPS